MTTFLDATSRFAVWTSEFEGDLFKANSIKIDGTYIYFYLDSKMIKQYKATEFISNNPKLFEAIKEK